MSTEEVIGTRTVTIECTYSPTMFTYTVNASPYASISVNGTVISSTYTATVPEGTQISVSAVMNQGYTFAQWDVFLPDSEDTSVINQQSFTDTIDANMDYTLACQTYSCKVGVYGSGGRAQIIDVTSGQSSPVTTSSLVGVSVFPGDTVRYVATPAQGYEFDGWYVKIITYQRYAGDNPLEVGSVSGDATLYAKFVLSGDAERYSWAVGQQLSDYPMAVGAQTYSGDTVPGVTISCVRTQLTSGAAATYMWQAFANGTPTTAGVYRGTFNADSDSPISVVITVTRASYTISFAKDPSSSDGDVSKTSIIVSPETQYRAVSGSADGIADTMYFSDGQTCTANSGNGYEFIKWIDSNGMDVPNAYSALTGSTTFYAKYLKVKRYAIQEEHRGLATGVWNEFHNEQFSVWEAFYDLTSHGIEVDYSSIVFEDPSYNAEACEVRLNSQSIEDQQWNISYDIKTAWPSCDVHFRAIYDVPEDVKSVAGISYDRIIITAQISFGSVLTIDTSIRLGDSVDEHQEGYCDNVPEIPGITIYTHPGITIRGTPTTIGTYYINILNESFETEKIWRITVYNTDSLSVVLSHAGAIQEEGIVFEDTVVLPDSIRVLDHTSVSLTDLEEVSCIVSNPTVSTTGDELVLSYKVYADVEVVYCEFSMTAVLECGPISYEIPIMVHVAAKFADTATSELMQAVLYNGELIYDYSSQADPYYGEHIWKRGVASPVLSEWVTNATRLTYEVLERVAGISSQITDNYTSFSMYGTPAMAGTDVRRVRDRYTNASGYEESRYYHFVTTVVDMAADVIADAEVPGVTFMAISNKLRAYGKPQAVGTTLVTFTTPVVVLKATIKVIPNPNLFYIRIDYGAYSDDIDYIPVIKGEPVTIGEDIDLSDKPELVFKGWYLDDEGEALLSDRMVYTFVPQSNMSLFAMWYYDGEMPGKAFLSRVYEGKYRAISLPIITQITEVYSANLTKIPTIIYGADNRFVMDLGTYLKYNVSVARVQPHDYDDNSTEEAQWSNGKWYNELIKLFDFWQNLSMNNDTIRTGGLRFYFDPAEDYPADPDLIGLPSSGKPYQSLAEEKQARIDQYYTKIDKNVFVAGQVEYSIRNLQTIEVTLPLLVATMHPIAPKVKYRTFVFKYSNEEGEDRQFTKEYPVGTTITLPSADPEWESMDQSLIAWMEGEQRHYPETSYYVQPGDDDVVMYGIWASIIRAHAFTTVGSYELKWNSRAISARVILVGGGGAGGSSSSIGSGPIKRAGGSGGGAGDVLITMFAESRPTFYIEVGAGASSASEDGSPSTIEAKVGEMLIYAAEASGGRSGRASGSIETSANGGKSVDERCSGGKSGRISSSYTEIVDGEDGGTSAPNIIGNVGKGSRCIHGANRDITGAGGGGAAKLNMTLNNTAYASKGGDAGGQGDSDEGGRGSPGVYGGGGGGGNGGTYADNGVGGPGGDGIAIVIFYGVTYDDA